MDSVFWIGDFCIRIISELPYAALLCEEFEVSPERALQDCRTLVSQMRQAGWIA